MICKKTTLLLPTTFSVIWCVIQKIVIINHSILSLQISQWLFRLKKILSTIDAPPGVPGVLKNHIFLQMKQFSVCAKIALKKHKLQKPSTLKKTCQKIPVFLDIFEYSSTWGQSMRTKLQLAPLGPLGAHQ